MRQFHVSEQGSLYEREQPGLWHIMYRNAQAGTGFYPLPYGHVAFNEFGGCLNAREAAEAMDKIVQSEMRRAMEYSANAKADHNPSYWNGAASAVWQRVNAKRRERDLLLIVANADGGR